MIKVQVTADQVVEAVRAMAPVLAAHLGFEGMAAIHLLPDGKGGVFVRDETSATIGFPGAPDWPKRRNFPLRPKSGKG